MLIYHCNFVINFILLDHLKDSCLSDRVIRKWAQLCKVFLLFVCITSSAHAFKQNITTHVVKDKIFSVAPYTMKQVCYYGIPRSGSWDKTLKDLKPENIPPDLCTHIIIAFASISNKCIKPISNADVVIYQKIINLKNANPNLKVMLSLSGGFSELVKERAAVDEFAFNAHQFLVDHNFDGLDLDWEFPSWPPRIRNREEKFQFTYLVIQLWNALKLASHPPLLLSLAVAAPKTIVRTSYEIESLAQNVDFFNLMGYDFRMYWPYFPFTGYNSPLHKGKRDLGYFETLNIEWAANYWVENGAPCEKLIIGIPTYGRTWRLLSFLWNKVGAPAVGSGIYGGSIAYPEALNFLKKGGIRTFDNNGKVPYASMDKDWISYEDRESIYQKALWIKSQNFAGVMTWNLNCDDFVGVESGRKFDLHMIIKQVIET